MVDSIGLITYTKVRGKKSNMSYNPTKTYISPMVTSGLNVSLDGLTGLGSSGDSLVMDGSGTDMTWSGINTTPFSHISHQITDLASISGSYSIDLDGTAVQKATLIDDMDFSVTNQSATESKSLNMYITASGATMTLTFDSNWKWLTTAPTELADGTTALLTVMSIGSDVDEVIAAYEELGDGS